MTLTVSPTASRRWLLSEPDFRRLWLVGLVVFSVRWLEMLAVAVFAYQRTSSPLIVALLTMLRMLPMALFGALDRRRGGACSNGASHSFSSSP